MVKICFNEESLAHVAAGIFVEQFEMAMARSESFNVVLSGGKTPLPTYELLTEDFFKDQIDWRRVHVFFGDERCVPAADSRSNFGTAHRHFLSRVPIPSQQVYPMFRDQGSPEKLAIDYENTIRLHFSGSPPSFDLVFLGLGDDGHTASLFPGSSALGERVRWVVPIQKPKEDFARLTMTLPILNLTQMALFLVTGQDKAEILKKVLANSEPSQPLPAQLIRPIEGSSLWLADSSAAQLVDTAKENL